MRKFAGGTPFVVAGWFSCWALAACDDGTAPALPGGADVRVGADAEVSLPPLPSFDVLAQASETGGNAPLKVELQAIVTGSVSPAALTYHWVFGSGTTYDQAEFTHTFAKAGIEKLTVTATYQSPDGRVASASGSVTIQVTACAQLYFEKVSIAAPTEIAPGDPVILKVATLVNDGGEVATPFECKAALSKNELYEPEIDPVVATWPVESMASGHFQSSTKDFAAKTFLAPADLAEGNYYVFLVADAGDRVNECDEDDNAEPSTNNLNVDPTLQFKPDLTASEVSFAAGLKLSQGDLVTYSFRVGNQGQGESALFRFGVWLSEDPELDPTDPVMSAPTDIGNTVQKFAAQTSQKITKSYPIPKALPDGSYWIIAVVDTEGQVFEDEEGNNLAVSAVPFEVHYDAPQCFDLNFEELAFVPPSTYWGGTVLLQGKVSNPGTQVVPEGWVLRAYITISDGAVPADSTKVGEWAMPVLAPGEVQELEQVVSIPSQIPVSPHTAFAILDPDNKLTECSEANNARVNPEKIAIASKASVDLGVTEVEFHPTEVAAGEAIKISYSLFNTGSSAASPFSVGVLLSEDVTIDPATDPLIAETVVATLLPTTTKLVVEDVLIPLALEHGIAGYWVGVIADRTQTQKSDKNPTNNLAKAPGKLTVTGALGGCFEDAFEDNDSYLGAAPLGAGTTPALGLCGDEDWYAIDVEAGQSLVMTLDAQAIQSLNPVPWDVDLELLTEDLVKLDTSTTAGGWDEVQAYTVPEAAIYLVRVFGKGPTARASYGLEVQLIDPVEGVDLMVADVAALPSSLYPGGVLHVAWSEVDLGTDPGPPHTARVWLSADAALDSAKDLLLAETLLDGVQAHATMQVALDVLLPDDVPGGTWRILVQTDADDDVAEAIETNNLAASNPITLDVSLACKDDSDEPNDALAIATPVPLGEEITILIDRVVCPLLPDYYAVELVEGTSLSATVNYKHDPEKGLLGLELWDSSGETIVFKQEAKDKAQVTLPWVWSSGTYYLRAYHADADGAPYKYKLSLSLAPGDPASFCKADLYEPNNAFGSAKVIGCGTQKATLCKGDVDVYRLDVGAGSLLSIELNQSKAQLRMTLFGDPTSPSLATQSGNGTLLYSVPTDQSLLLRVEPKGDALLLTDLAYTLKVIGVPGADLSVDGVAPLLAEVYQGDDDLIDFALTNGCADPAGEQVTSLWLSKDGDLDPADIEVGHAWVEGVVGYQTLPMSEKIAIPMSTAPGPYWLIVEADAGQQIAESNELNNTAVAALAVAKVCLPDGSEPNDFPASKAPFGVPAVVPPGLEDLALCPYDLDWFAIEVTGGKTLQVSIAFSHAEGDLDLRLYDPAYSTAIPVATSGTKADFEAVSWPVAVSGTFLVRVNGFAGASAAYGLEVKVD
jgi:PKD repeat protein